MKFNELGERVEFNLEIFKPTINEPLAMWTPDGKIGPISSPYPFQINGRDYSQERKKFIVVTKYVDPYFMLKSVSNMYCTSYPAQILHETLPIFGCNDDDSYGRFKSILRNFF